MTSEKTIDRVILEKSLRLKELAAPDDTPPAGYATIYRGDDGKFYGLGSDGISTPVGSGGSVIKITQTAHSFTVGANVYQGAVDLELTRADVDATSEVIGTVSRVLDVDNFELTLGGEITGIPLTAFEGAVPVKGSELWLSTSADGKFTVTKPSVIGQSGKPIGYVREVGATVSIVLNIMRGENIGGTNAVVPRFLANGAKTLIQDFSNMDGGKVTGVLTIVSDTPLRNEYEIRFVKNGAGVYQGTATGLGGDAAGIFEMDNDGKLQCTIATHTNLSYARFDYQVQAPAVGATFPLTIGESKLLADGGAQQLDVVANAGNTVTNLTSTSPRTVVVVSDGTTTHDMNLPSTDIKKGYTTRIEVQGATENNPVIFKAGGSELGGAGLGRIGGEGFILLRATQDDPTLAAHWKVVDVEENTPNFVTAGSGANTNNITYKLNRRKSSAFFIFIGQSNLSAIGTNTSISLATGVPSRFRPINRQVNAWGVTTGGIGFQPGSIDIAVDGKFLARNISLTAFTSSCNFSVGAGQSCNYTLN